MSGYKTLADWINDIERYRGLWEEAKRKHAWEDAAYYKAKMSAAQRMAKMITSDTYGKAR